MANLTITQIKARCHKIAFKLEEILEMIQDLKDEAQEEADNIEPYGDKYDLTPSQEERQEKLQEIADTLEDHTYTLDEISSDLENISE